MSWRKVCDDDIVSSWWRISSTDVTHNTVLSTVQEYNHGNRKTRELPWCQLYHHWRHRILSHRKNCHDANFVTTGGATITRLIWTIWTSLSAVPRKAVKFNHSITHHRWHRRYSLCHLFQEYLYLFSSKYVLITPSGNLMPIFFCCSKLDWHYTSPSITPLDRPGVGVTKAPFVNFSVSKIFDLAEVPVRLFVSHSYLTGVTTAELRQHLSNMNMIFNR